MKRELEVAFPELQFLRIVELFSVPGLSPMVQHNDMFMDLTTCWDIFSHDGQLFIWRDITYFGPLVVILSPGCKGFAESMNGNSTGMLEWKCDFIQDMCFARWFLSIQVAVLQVRNGRYHVLKHLWGVSSWSREILHNSASDAPLQTPKGRSMYAGSHSVP